jgi:hypothetical protein
MRDQDLTAALQFEAMMPPIGAFERAHLLREGVVETRQAIEDAEVLLREPGGDPLRVVVGRALAEG